MNVRPTMPASWLVAAIAATAVFAAAEGPSGSHTALGDTQLQALLPVVLGEEPATDGDWVRMPRVMVEELERVTRPHEPAPPAGAPALQTTSVDKRAYREEKMVVTAYCPCSECCGKWSRYRLTASGKPVTHNAGQFVAADGSVPFGTRISIPGYANGIAVPVLDRGGAIRGQRLDVFFPNHKQARRFGRQTLTVKIYE